MNENVCVLLSAFNGEEFINQQIDSIQKQENVSSILVIRDDGSSDNTVKIVIDLANKNSNIFFPDEINGFHCNHGIGSSFFTLLRYAVNNFPDCTYFSFSDQDDYWLPNKLSTAVNQLSAYEDEPAIYFSKKKIVDVSLKNEVQEDTVLFKNNLCDYLGQNQAFGCTMVINRNFAEMLLKAPVEEYPFLHDIVIFRLATCIGAKIVFDEGAYILYRQHGTNVTGPTDSKVITKDNAKKVFYKRRHYLSLLSQIFLSQYRDNLVPDAVMVLTWITQYRSKPSDGMRLINYFNNNSDRGLKEKGKFAAKVMLRAL